MAISSPRATDRLVVRRLQQRFGALVVASALIGTSVPAIAIAAPTQEEIGRMYGEGQEYMEQKEYKRAAEVFTRLLNLIDESAENKAIRESLILNILDAHMQAYEGIVGPDGKRDVGQLETAKSTLQKYYSDFQSVHGDSVAVIAEIQTSATKLDQLLSDIPGPIVDPDKTKDEDKKDEDKDKPKQELPPRGAAPANEGLGFIIGGVGLGVLGVGAAIMIPVGSALGNDAEIEFNNATTDGDRAAAKARGDRANAILISGAVLAPLLVGGAVALIVIGAKRRKQSQMSMRPVETLTAAPAVGRDDNGGRFTGFSLQGRF